VETKKKSDQLGGMYEIWGYKGEKNLQFLSKSWKTNISLTF
jgi:hypothetical protein